MYTFPAGVNAGSGQSGPCYNCLLTTPNPAWYFMKVATPGSIIIYMYSTPSEDIDFCLWGPYTSQNCCTQLTCNKVVDCSYSPAPTETVNIPNGQTGEYYMLVITNFSNNPCNINFSQTGGTGTTDCTILPPPATNNSPICSGQTLLLSAQPVTNAIYNWWGPAGFQSNLQNPSIPNAQPVNSGEYFLSITVNGLPSSDTSVTTAYIYQPVADAGNDTTIPNGVFTTLHGNCAGGSGSYNYNWEPADKLVDPYLREPQTVNLFSTTVFTLTVTDDSASCTSSDMVTISIEGGALTVNAIADPSAVCAGATTQLHAIGSGGAGNYSYEWSGPGGFSSNLPDPVVLPVATSVYSVTVSDGYNTADGGVTVQVIPLPVPDAGPDDSIPYGTYTFLHGSVPGGSSTYFYSWEPAAKLVNPNVQYPQTTNLTGTTIFLLTVTDLQTNCVCNIPGEVTIEVTGGPLAADPVAIPPSVCLGDSSRLHAGAGGGNTGFYQYSWVSDPPGFSSSLENPYVAPVENTTYHLTVNDGFNTATGQTSVFIFPQPVVYLGPPDTVVCVYDSLLLNAGNPGADYLWSNGAVTQTIRIGTTGIGYDYQHYSVSVTSPDNCETTAEINVVFDFNACVGINDPLTRDQILFYPNPAGRTLMVDTRYLHEDIGLTIMTLTGQPIIVIILTYHENNLIKEVDLSSLSAGMYLIRASTNSQTLTRKLIIGK
jgi:hypothetical protein